MKIGVGAETKYRGNHFMKGAKWRALFCFIVALAAGCFAAACAEEHVHEYEAVVTPPTCTEQGYTTYTCPEDGESYVGDYVEPLGHTPAEAVKENVVDATCLGGGSYDLTIYCSVCGEELSRESVEVEKKDHTPETVPGKEATCTQAGLTEGSKCSVCGTVLKEQEEIPAKGHTPSEAKKENEKTATCTEAGSYDEVVYCSVCKEEISRKHVQTAALGHAWGSGAVTTAPTCSATGVRTYTCSRCDAKRTENIPMTAHTPVTVPGKAATCFAPGLTEGSKCSVCGIVLTEQEVIPAAHTSGEAVEENKVAATCTAEGSYEEVVYCTVCEIELSRRTVTVPKAEHTPGAAATCTSPQICTACGMTLADALGHAWGTGTVTKEPTCTEEGIETFICAVCKDTKTEPVVKLGHDLVHHEGQAATCTAAGWEAYVACSRCSYTTYQEIPVAGHKFADHVCSVCYAIEMVGQGNVPVGNTVAVHDPSIIVAYADAFGNIYPDAGETGSGRQKMYFIFGTQLSFAYSYDMESWVTFTPVFYEEDSTVVSTDHTKIFASAAAWPGYADAATIKGNLWAPDIIYNPELKKWCLYYSMSGDSSNFRSSVFMMTADKLTGPYVFEDFVVFSGFNKGTGAGVEDYKKVTGESSVPERYSNDKGAWNNNYGVSCIDPAVLYDEAGELWLNYGSWSGGIFLIKLDNKTGLRDTDHNYGYTDVTYDTTDTTALVYDPYLGIHIAGGWYVSGEGPYIAYFNGYYYLFLSYGFYSPEGGYNMRVFCSKDITGKYTDMDGTWAVYASGGNNYGNDLSHGEVLMQNYKWSWWTNGYTAQGHNSVLVDGDKIYLVYHVKYNDGSIQHNVEVHELVIGENGWPLAAPFQKSEDDKVVSVDMNTLAGSWSVILHTPVDYKNLKFNTDSVITLEAGGTVSGAYTGTWSLYRQYITITLHNNDGSTTTYTGVVMEQQIEGLAGTNVAYTFTATNASTNTPLWGVKNPEGMGAAESVLNSLVLPGEILASINLPTEGDFGTTISYESSNESVLSSNGVYTAPTEDTEVTLTVKVTSSGYSTEKVFTIKVLSEASANALLANADGESVIPADFIVAKAAPLAGETVARVSAINASTGVSLTFRVENITSDWDVIFRATGKKAIVYLAVLNYLGVDIFETAATLSPEGAAILEAYYKKNPPADPDEDPLEDGASNWMLFLGNLCDNADKSCIATISYNVDGSITFYRDGVLMLTYAANTAIGTSTVSNLSRYMAEQVGSYGLEVVWPVEDLIIGYAADYTGACEHSYGAYEGDTATCIYCGGTKVRVEVGEKMYEAELPVEQALTSPDPSASWDDNVGFGQVALSGDFLIRYEWDNSRDPNYWDAWFELFDANNNWYTAPVMEPGSTQTVNGWGGLYTNVVVEVTCNGEPYTLPVGGTANAYAGHYIATAYRVGSTFTLKVVLEKTDGDVVVVTRTSENFTTDALTAQLNGNTNLLDNFTVTHGTLTEVQEEVLATDRMLGNEDNSTAYTGATPLWTGSISQGQRVTATGTATCNPNPTEGSNPPDRGVWNAPLPYIWTGAAASLNFRPDNWVNGDGSQETYGAFNFAITKTFQGFTDTSLNGTDWTTTLVNYYNEGEYGCTIVWDYTASDVIVITFAFDFDDVTYNQRYEIRATGGKTLLETYSIGLGVDYACFKVDSITRQ